VRLAELENRLFMKASKEVSQVLKPWMDEHRQLQPRFNHYLKAMTKILWMRISIIINHLMRIAHQQCLSGPAA
jgi:hypothetical protein